MPFCSRCGNQVTDADQYCSKCGAPQPGARTAPDFAASMTPRTASILCYIPWVGWIASIFVLASKSFRDNRTVRFHAFQGLYLFVAWLILEWVSFPLHFIPGHVRFPISSLLQLGILVLWIVMIVKTSREEVYSLPVIGELAEKSLSE